MIDFFDEKHINVFYPFAGKNGIGDFVICAGLCPEISLKYGLPVRFICHESLSRFDFKYSNTEMIYLNDQEFDMCAKKWKEIDANNYIYGWFRKNNDGDYIRGNDVNFADEIKKYVFDLPLSACIYAPIIEENYTHINNYGGAVILAPYATSSWKLRDELINVGWWEDLSSALIELGYKVYTNTNEDQKTIKGTESISVSGSELVDMALSCRCIIGIRMGLLDLLSLIGARVICVTNMGFFHFDLQNMFPDANVVSCYLCNRFIEEIKSSMIIGKREKMIMDNLKAEITFDIKTKDESNERCFCLSYEDLTNKVLKNI